MQGGSVTSGYGNVYTLVTFPIAFSSEPVTCLVTKSSPAAWAPEFYPIVVINLNCI